MRDQDDKPTRSVKAVRAVRVEPPIARPSVPTPLPIGIISSTDGSRSLDGSQEIREIVKARTIAGSVCVTLPKALRDYLGIDSGDRLMIALDKVNRCLVITKE